MITKKKNKKLPYQVYEEFVNDNKDFDSLDDEIKLTLICYIGTQCSDFITNHYSVRVTEEDILKHLRREINIFSLEEHIYYPTKHSPKEIYLGGNIWKLDAD